MIQIRQFEYTLGERPAMTVRRATGDKCAWRRLHVKSVTGQRMLSSRVPRNDPVRPSGAASSMSTIKTTLYGIPNCDTVKRARAWLAAHGQDVAFHDFKKHGLERATAAAWLERLDWEVLVNRKGTTWRTLSEARRGAVIDKASALELMLEMPSVIKRPVLAWAGMLSVGFSDQRYAELLGGQARP